LSTQDCRERPAENTAAADKSHARFANPQSEFLSLLTLWEYLKTLHASRESSRKHEQALRSEFLSPLRIREWREVHQQLSELVGEMHWKPNEIAASHESIHLAVLSGLLSNIGCRMPDEPVWLGCHDVKFLIWPGSLLAKKPPRWLMAGEQVETSRLFARMIAAIEPEWVERLAGHVLKKSVAEPHWEKKTGKVVGYERATLHGLTIYQRRKISWAQRGDSYRREAREIFIRQALVEGDWECPHRFFAHNAKRIREVEVLEHKARRPDILVDDELLFAFYDQSIPDSVFDAQSFGDWYCSAVRGNAELLCLKKEDLMRHEAAGITTEQFPKQLDVSGVSYALEYHFAPGDSRDGATLVVPLEKLGQLDPVPLEWLVPGMRKEKVLALLKSLPQKTRRHCVPLPDYAQEFCDRWKDKAGRLSLIAALIQDISQETGISVKRDEFKLDGVAAHCWMNIRVIDMHGRRLAEGRSLESLRGQLGIDSPVEQNVAVEGRKAWIERFEEVLKEPFTALDKEIRARPDLGVGYSAFGGLDQLSAQLRERVIVQIFLAQGLPESESEFESRLRAGKSKTLLIAQEALRWATAVLQEHAAIGKKMAALKTWPAAHSDIQAQLSRLLPKDFLVSIATERASHVPRYLRAISVRIDKCRADSIRDQRQMAELAQVEPAFWRWASQQRGAWPDRFLEFRWMLEELRVSLFAQELKTAMPVSVKRLQRSWASLVE
jgi:ATP-dependent helicase HrpA